MGQVVSSANSYQLQGAVAELDFHARAGSNFTGASSQMQAYVIYGTSTDEGASKMAFGLNAGGGGGSGWTGQTNAASPLVTIGTTIGRYAVVANIPTTAKEVGVAFCWTPVGTASTNDYISLAGIQLVRNSALANQAATTTANGGYSCADNTLNGQTQCSAFDRRLAQVEAALQYQYYYQITEGAAAGERGLCRSRSTTACSWDIKFPVPMRIAPTMTYTAGFATETTALGGTLGNCTALAADVQVSTAVASVTDAYAVCTATTVPAAGTVDQIYDNGNSGAVKASSEL